MINISRFRKKVSQACVTCMVLASGLTQQVLANDKPNFVWILSEDNSKHFMSLYNKSGAKMPELEALAEHGLIFENAMSNAPVCSTARTTLATGAYGPRIGTQFHRAAVQAQLPTGLKSVYEMMREAGYYVTNNSKTDFNFIESEHIWDASSKQATWRERKTNQPFFHVQTFYNTHESTLHFPESDFEDHPLKHNPNQVELFPIYPDTQVFRYTHARYLDHHLAIDELIGEVIQKLKEDGELENTFVFYMGDHGGVLPASKGQIYERGLAIPLVVRIPKNFAHLVGKDLRSPHNLRVNGVVSFVDFAPTVLNLAGQAKSSQQDGEAFLGPDISLKKLNLRNTSYSYGDRFDDKINTVRAVRKGKYKYIRSFTPYYAWGLHSYYRYKQIAYKEWRDLYKSGQLNPAQSAFFEPVEAEQLFDVEADPHEMNNLAKQAKYKSILLDLRNNLNTRLRKWQDLSIYPESYLVKHALQNTEHFKQLHQTEIQDLISIANLQLHPFNLVKDRLAYLLTTGSEWQQYWSLIVLSSYGKQAEQFRAQAELLLAQSDSLYVKSRALEFLTIASEYDPREQVQALLQQAKWLQLLEVLNIAAFLHETHDYVFKLPNGLYETIEKMELTQKLDKAVQYSILERLTFISTEENRQQ